MVRNLWRLGCSLNLLLRGPFGHALSLDGMGWWWWWWRIDGAAPQVRKSRIRAAVSAASAKGGGCDAPHTRHGRLRALDRGILLRLRHGPRDGRAGAHATGRRAHGGSRSRRRRPRGRRREGRRRAAFGGVAQVLVGRPRRPSGRCGTRRVRDRRGRRRRLRRRLPSLPPPLLPLAELLPRLLLLLLPPPQPLLLLVRQRSRQERAAARGHPGG